MVSKAHLVTYITHDDTWMTSSRGDMSVSSILSDECRLYDNIVHPLSASRKLRLTQESTVLVLSKQILLHTELSSSNPGANRLDNPSI